MFDLPSASTIVSSTTAYSADLFTAFLPVIWLVVGLVVAVSLALYIKRSVNKGIRKVTGHRR